MRPFDPQQDRAVRARHPRAGSFGPDEDPWTAYGDLRDRFLGAVRAKKTLTRPLTLPADAVTREVPPPEPASKGRRRRKAEAPRAEPDEAV